MREHHLGRFVAREHIEIRQPNRQLPRYLVSIGELEIGCECSCRMNGKPISLEGKQS